MEIIESLLQKQTLAEILKETYKLQIHPNEDALVLSKNIIVVLAGKGESFYILGIAPID